MLSFNSYGKGELDFSSDTFCDQSPKAQVRNGLFFLPNQEEPYSGENLCVYLSNGQYSSQGEIKNGLRHGSWSFWKENGQKLNDKTFLEDMVVSETKYEYYENGQIESKITTKDGEVDGISTRWYENGQKWMEGNYKDGEPDGELNSWYENGQIQSELYFKDGKEDDKWTLWYENSQIQGEANYKDGKEDGKVTEWYENGQMQYEINFNNSIPDGNWISWFDNGLENGTGFFENGTGEYNEFFESGEKSYQLFYKDGFGIKTYWYKNGEKKSQANFINGKLNGTWTYWNENGHTVEEEMHKLEKEKAKLAEIKRKTEEVKAQEAEILAKEVKAIVIVKEAEAKRIAEELKLKEAEAKRIALEIEIKKAEVKQSAVEAKTKEAELLVKEASKQLEQDQQNKDLLELEIAALKESEAEIQYRQLLAREVQDEQDTARSLIIEDQLNTLQNAYINNIAARVRTFWRYQGAEDDWTAEVYVVQDRDGTVVAVDVRNDNVGDSSKAKAFINSIERAVNKACLLYTSPSPRDS